MEVQDEEKDEEKKEMEDISEEEMKQFKDDVKKGKYPSFTLKEFSYSYYHVER